MGSLNGVSRKLHCLRQLIPNLGDVSHGERLRASLGALAGLLVTGFVSRLALGSGSDLPLLIAPMGASAVLLFAVPASPLAQPWSILGGNMVAALIGITCGRLIADPVAAAALACACAIGAMLMLRCLHPPSGAVALTAVLGGPAIHAAGYTFAVWPVGLNSLLLLVAALLFNNATGRRYPHVASTAAEPRRPVTPVRRRDIAAVLRRHDEVIDIDRDDLLTLMDEAGHVARARAGPPPPAAALMTPAGPTLTPQTDVEAAFTLLAETGGSTLPVTDAEGRLVGTLPLAALLRHLRPTRTGRNMARRFRRTMRFDLEPRIVADAMEPLADTVAPDESLDSVATLMICGAVTSMPVVSADGILLGRIDSAAVLAALYRGDLRVQPRSVIQRL